MIDIPVCIEPLHFSQLKCMGQSPAHFRHYLESGRRDSTAMRRGRAVHAMLLGGPAPLTYHKRRAGKEWDAFKAEHAGQEILSVSEAADVEGMVRAVKQHEIAHQLIVGATVHEQKIAWTRNGVRCEGTPDFVLPGQYLGELKCAVSSAPAKFQWQARSMGYNAQLAWYAYGLRELGITVPETFIVAVESAAPYPVTVFRLTPSALLVGDMTCSAWLEQLKNCVSSDHWPSYAQDVVDLDAISADPDSADEPDEIDELGDEEAA
jgi:hypothetical protein